MSGDRGLLMDALVEGVGSQMPRGRVWNLDKAVEPLLPVVERIANERAAAALREAASDVDDGEFSDRWSDAARRALLARADQLDPS